jgi:hypothetical protein
MKRLRFLSLTVCIFLVGSLASLYAQEQSANQAPTAVETPPAPIPEISALSAPVPQAAPVAPGLVEQPTVQPVAVPVLAPTVAPASAAVPSAPKFVVFMPERVDLMWFWYYYTDVQQHLVQSAVEKALVSAGKDIVDLTLSDAFQAGGALTEVTNPAEALKKAMMLGATFAIIGQAQAIQSGENVAYGVRVVRANAEANARLIRVKDGKLIAMEEAGAQGNGPSSQAAAQAALKDVGKIIASKLAAAASRLESAE